LAEAASSASSAKTPAPLGVRVVVGNVRVLVTGVGVIVDF
jgi:hypothetical protein